MVANVAVSMLSKRWMSLEDGCVGHKLIKASTLAIGLQKISLAPLCHIGC